MRTKKNNLQQKEIDRLNVVNNTLRENNKRLSSEVKELKASSLEDKGGNVVSLKSAREVRKKEKEIRDLKFDLEAAKHREEFYKDLYNKACEELLKHQKEPSATEKYLRAETEVLKKMVDERDMKISDLNLEIKTLKTIDENFTELKEELKAEESLFRVSICPKVNCLTKVCELDLSWMDKMDAALKHSIEVNKPNNTDVNLIADKINELKSDNYIKSNTIESLKKKLFSVVSGKQTIFHGGCHGCKSQLALGVKRCLDCQYYNADWSKPNLHTEKQ